MICETLGPPKAPAAWRVLPGPREAPRKGRRPKALKLAPSAMLLTSMK